MKITSALLLLLLVAVEFAEFTPISASVERTDNVTESDQASVERTDNVTESDQAYVERRDVTESDQVENVSSQLPSGRPREGVSGGPWYFPDENVSRQPPSGRPIEGVSGRPFCFPNYRPRGPYYTGPRGFSTRFYARPTGSPRTRNGQSSGPRGTGPPPTESGEIILS